jgi:pimeloyl-ACP methyl ester carboxylesterase
LDDIIATLHAVVQHVSPDQPVTLLLHDWGCIFGYELALRHPQSVGRVIAVDIGDYNAAAYMRSLTLGQKLMVAFYQVWLATAWLFGRYLSATLGNALTRWMARAMRCPNPSSNIRWYMNFPYAMAWFGVGGGLRKALRVKREWPLLYLYGKRKPFGFQSPKWLAEVAQAPGCEVHAMDSGHWVMVDQPKDFAAKVLAWLAS